MLRVCKSMSLAAGVMTSAAVLVEAQTLPMPDGRGPAIRDVTVRGCVPPPQQPNAYVIDVSEDASPPSADPIAPGTSLRLVGLPPDDFQDYVGQQVEVFGMVLPHGSGKGRKASGGDANSKLGVRYIRELAPTCAAPVTSPVPTGPVQATDNRGHGRSRGSRNAALRTPAVSSPTRPQTVQTPRGPVVVADAQAITNTSKTPGVIGTAPSNSTAANAGLGQSGISGSATLSGSVAMTPPVFTFPIGRTPPPAPGSTPSTAPRSTPPTVPGSTPPASSASTVPGSLPPTGGSLPPTGGSLPPTGGLAQGASNTTTTNAALDQFGLSGDALLSGLVNVNVQQLLASVQVQANLNVQDVIVNLSDILNDNQIQLLVQALNTNPQAALNASDLTSALQSSGVLAPSEWVVGVTGSQIYANKTLTDALQSRGIIQPSETIMKTANPHVFVVGPTGGGQ